MTPTPETLDISSYTPIVGQKNQLMSKWNLVFANDNRSAWISFKPQLDLHVYPCYACRDMFASKVTFQDHTNRRAVLIKYNCRDCDQSLTFYNRCSLLLHARTHFSLTEGRIDLDNTEIFSLPFGMMGFLPHPGIAKLFDVDEDRIDENLYLNAQFYSPDTTEKGKQIITLKPNDLLFCCPSEEVNAVQLTLKQISNNIPLCQFVTVDYQKKLKQNCSVVDNAITVKEEIPESNEISVESSLTPIENRIQMPVISKIESLSSEDSTYPKCPECKETQRCSMKMHFIGKNLPYDEDLKCLLCKYVASTKCSYTAHERIHRNSPPFICPECGKKFENRDYMMNHLDDVCFHLAKQVRIRCPGKKCGKLFASTLTFATHFEQHIRLWVQCTVCKECFENVVSFSEHAKIHSNLCFSGKVYKCLGCKNEDSIIYPDNVRQHVEFHANDRSRCMYVFICKFCKNYFRSTLTYATHLLKCQKMQSMRKQGYKFTLDSCIQCHNRIIFYENESFAACSKCRFLNTIHKQQPLKNVSDKNNVVVNEVRVCLLCKEEYPYHDRKSHLSKCVYRNPTIVVTKLGDNQISKHCNSDTSNDSISDPESHSATEIRSIETEDSPSGRMKSVSPKSQDGLKRKRKRASFVFRTKKPRLSISPEKSIDLQADQATPFTGTYYCKLCEFKDIDRLKFHQHIVMHRDISTAYQCMECGECFVVKPSLIKHLTHYHKIEDTNSYLENNNCYDKTAVEELKEMMKLVPGESREPVKENQCRVCLEQFPDCQELSKHFRIHGMAFLMKNTRD